MVRESKVGQLTGKSIMEKTTSITPEQGSIYLGRMKQNKPGFTVGDVYITHKSKAGSLTTIHSLKLEHLVKGRPPHVFYELVLDPSNYVTREGILSLPIFHELLEKFQRRLIAHYQLDSVPDFEVPFNHMVNLILDQLNDDVTCLEFMRFSHEVGR